MNMGKKNSKDVAEIEKGYSTNGIKEMLADSCWTLACKTPKNNEKRRMSTE